MVLVLYPVITHADSSKKFDFLMYFYDMNETSFAYHRHCLSTETPINPTFLNTLEFVANELLAESIKRHPKMSPEYIRTKILERRYNIQYRLDHTNMTEGCHTESSLAAKEHYREFSNYKESEIRKFINEKTSD